MPAAGNGNHPIDLDGLFGRPLIITFRGKDHVVAADLLTMEVVTRVQAMMQSGEDAQESEDFDAMNAFADELQGFVGDMLAQAKPPLRVGDIPPRGLAFIAAAVIQHAFEGADPPTPPPNRTARRSAAKGTRATKS
jgi:hypothetical protein